MAETLERSTPARTTPVRAVTHPSESRPNIPTAELEFNRLEPCPGVWLQEVGEYGEKGMTKRAAVAIGPEFGTVGTELTREAAKEAVTFADVLVVCGFAFNPLAGEETTELGRLTVLRTRLSPDLLVGDLKKTGRPVPVLDNGSHEDRVRSGGEVTLPGGVARSSRSVGVEQLEHGGHRVQRRKR